jgi:hypothetical protein
VVPVEQAYLLTGLLLSRGLRPEVEVYPGVGHLFCGDGGKPQVLSLLRAKRRVDSFLDGHLRPGAVVTRTAR